MECSLNTQGHSKQKCSTVSSVSKVIKHTKGHLEKRYKLRKHFDQKLSVWFALKSPETEIVSTALKSPSDACIQLPFSRVSVFAWLVMI